MTRLKAYSAMVGRGVLACVAAVLCGAAGADPVEVSPAETLIFLNPHLKDVAPSTQLRYAFRKSGTLEQTFTDTVNIDIMGQPDGSKKGVAHFFTGPRRIAYPDVEHVEGNPVIMFYLEREIREMARLTAGQAEYFRKRIRMALAESARITNVDVRLGNRTLPAQRITIAPYESDPNRDRFPQLAAKQYEFTFSDKVPGSVYQLRGWVPHAAAGADQKPVLDETLTFKTAAALK